MKYINNGIDLLLYLYCYEMMVYDTKEHNEGKPKWSESQHLGSDVHL